MTPEQRIAEIRQRVEKATPGPWFTGPYYKADVHSREGVIRANCWSAPQAIADAEFIAQAREDMPYLLAALAQSEAASQQAEQEIASLHQFGKDWQRQALAAEAKVSALSDALRALVEDLEARWDMHDRRTNPGIVQCVEQAKAALAKTTPEQYEDKSSDTR